MLWIWILSLILLLAIIAIIVVLVVFSEKCKKGFEKSFGKYGDCFFDAAKKNLSKEHFKQVCQIVENCPGQLKECATAVLAVVSGGDPVIVKEDDGSYTLNPALVAACPGVCPTKYIHTDMSQEEMTQWSEEMTAAAQYVADHCTLLPHPSS